MGYVLKNCIGAIDSTHISASVLAEKQISCRDRKATITQNVMCACDFNMMFTYVYSGWEGSAHDSKILLDAITNQNAEFPWPPRGKSWYQHKIMFNEINKVELTYILFDEGSFYLVDSGYLCIGGFLPPYRGERYHAQELRVVLFTITYASGIYRTSYLGYGKKWILSILREYKNVLS